MEQVTWARSAGLLLAALCAGCGGGSGGHGSEVAAQVETTPLASTAPTSAPVIQERAEGGASFAVDGSARQFDALPDGHNYYTSLASQVPARPRVDAAEQLSITFMSIDLRKLEYPAQLPGPKQAGTLLDPLVAMAGVGFSYRTEDGTEWAGPGRVQIERFSRDGIIAGSFTDVSLPHTDKQLPNITLTAGAFRAQISTPW